MRNLCRLSKGIRYYRSPYIIDSVRGVSKNWFASYVSNRKQFVFLNGYKSNLAAVNCGVPQGSILGPALFLICINDLHLAIWYSEVHHFADDTSLLNFNTSVKTINKQVNHDLKNSANWLKANKYSFDVDKTELVLFASPKKQLDSDLKIKLNEKSLYLRIQTDKSLTWKQQVTNVALKLNKVNAMLSKLIL